MGQLAVDLRVSGAIDALLRIPVRVEDDDRVGADQVDADASRLGRDKEDVGS
jgi:hypothetical protein